MLMFDINNNCRTCFYTKYYFLHKNCSFLNFKYAGRIMKVLVIIIFSERLMIGTYNKRLLIAKLMCAQQKFCCARLICNFSIADAIFYL